MSGGVPSEIAPDLRRAKRLAWWTIGWMVSITAVMFLTMGGSQAMKTAFIEDVLSIVPSVVLLIALRLEREPPDDYFNYGLDRAHSLAFLIAAVALTGVGALLLVDALWTLALREHPTIASIFVFGQQVWLGWLMIAALVYSVLPPFILGHMKLPIARRAHDMVLHTDAKMQKADWMTGLAGVGGVIGIGLGFWWADALAAAVISLSILMDGITALRISSTELIDGIPRDLGSAKKAPDADALCDALQRRWPDADIRLRESGRYILAQVRGVAPPQEPVDLKQLWPCETERHWRFGALSFEPPEPDSR
jgi:cobalt-zinc-cadmium efflux system protein